VKKWGGPFPELLNREGCPKGLALLGIGWRGRLGLKRLKAETREIKIFDKTTVDTNELCAITEEAIVLTGLSETSVAEASEVEVVDLYTFAIDELRAVTDHAPIRADLREGIHAKASKVKITDLSSFVINKLSSITE
jgi:hypothetical protein